MATIHKITRMWNPGIERRMLKRLDHAYRISDWPGVAWAAGMLCRIRSDKRNRKRGAAYA